MCVYLLCDQPCPTLSPTNSVSSSFVIRVHPSLVRRALHNLTSVLGASSFLTPRLTEFHSHPPPLSLTISLLPTGRTCSRLAASPLYDEKFHNPFPTRVILF